MEGEFRDASAIVRVVPERHGIQCSSGILTLPPHPTLLANYSGE
jgi:hypothetical protein